VLFYFRNFISLLFRNSALCVAIVCVCDTETGCFSSLDIFLADTKVWKLRTYHHSLAFLPHGMTDVPVFKSIKKKMINDFIETKTAFSLDFNKTPERNSQVSPV